MTKSNPTILALDFDGVICDGLIEYFQTAWRAYCDIWNPVDTVPPSGLAERFYRLRPVVEHGWEMPVLVRSLILGIPDTELFAHWSSIATEQANATGLAPADFAAKVDGIRDQWIAEDVENWLAQHRFYPGVVECLRQVLVSDIYPVIITTKEQRFVRQLLAQEQLDLPESQIFGKEVRQPKAQTLRQLMQQFKTSHGISPTIWFIEDRVKTLQAIETQPDLESVTLFLADWGYNTAADRALAQQDPRLHLLSLASLSEPLSKWVEPAV